MRKSYIEKYDTIELFDKLVTTYFLYHTGTYHNGDGDEKEVEFTINIEITNAELEVVRRFLTLSI